MVTHTFRPSRERQRRHLRELKNSLVYRVPDGQGYTEKPCLLKPELGFSVGRA